MLMSKFHIAYIKETTIPEENTENAE